MNLRAGSTFPVPVCTVSFNIVFYISSFNIVFYISSFNIVFYISSFNIVFYIRKLPTMMPVWNVSPPMSANSRTEVSTESSSLLILEEPTSGSSSWSWRSRRSLWWTVRSMLSPRMWWPVLVYNYSIILQSKCDREIGYFDLLENVFSTTVGKYFFDHCREMFFRPLYENVFSTTVGKCFFNNCMKMFFRPLKMFVFLSAYICIEDVLTMHLNQNMIHSN